MRWSGVQWMGWWYLAIAAGFAALAVDHWLTGDTAWLVAIRFVLAGGFGFLAWNELVTKKRKH